jgi:hypothetical protein
MKRHVVTKKTTTGEEVTWPQIVSTWMQTVNDPFDAERRAGPVSLILSENDGHIS